jgi:aspartate aminotransferase
MVKLAKAPTSLFQPASTRFQNHTAQLEAAITPKTKALILCSPSNPTVACTPEKNSKAGRRAGELPNVIVISDEIYEHINYIGSHASIAEFEAIRDRWSLSMAFQRMP